MTKTLPPLFIERLKYILPREAFDSALKSFCPASSHVLRINTLKVLREDMHKRLKQLHIPFKTAAWSSDALILKAESAAEIGKTEFIADGLLYRQNLSSMIPVLILGPRSGERVLDMCAAPGGKTTQIAALMHNKGSIIAIEAVRGRYYKLKSVVSLLGAKNITCICMDGRRFRAKEGLFDKILLDAQCSCEAAFMIERPATYAYWSISKIKELSYKQKGLLLAAGRLLKKGGILVYSTCTFAPEENEMVIDWFLKKTGNEFEIENVSIKGISRYPVLLEWQTKLLDTRLAKCLRVTPSGLMEGFFIARLKKAS